MSELQPTSSNTHTTSNRKKRSISNISNEISEYVDIEIHEGHKDYLHHASNVVGIGVGIDTCTIDNDSGTTNTSTSTSTSSSDNNINNKGSINHRNIDIDTSGINTNTNTNTNNNNSNILSVETHIEEKHSWTEAEDVKLRAMVETGLYKWSEIASAIGRSIYACQRRWNKYKHSTQPSNEDHISKSPGDSSNNSSNNSSSNGKRWSSLESELLIRLVTQYGKKWHSISAIIPNRSDSSCHHHWYCTLCPRSKRLNGSGSSSGSGVDIDVPTEMSSDTSTDRDATPASVDNTNTNTNTGSNNNNNSGSSSGSGEQSSSDPQDHPGNANNIHNTHSSQDTQEQTEQTQNSINSINSMENAHIIEMILNQLNGAGSAGVCGAGGGDTVSPGSSSSNSSSNSSTGSSSSTVNGNIYKGNLIPLIKSINNMPVSGSSNSCSSSSRCSSSCSGGSIGGADSTTHSAINDQDPSGTTTTTTTNHNTNTKTKPKYIIWQPEEETLLRSTVVELDGIKRWEYISSKMTGRSGVACKHHWYNVMLPKEGFVSAVHAEIVNKASKLLGTNSSGIDIGIDGGGSNNNNNNNNNATTNMFSRVVLVVVVVLVVASTMDWTTLILQVMVLVVIQVMVLVILYISQFKTQLQWKQ